jgi:hypothetical protein
MHCQNCNTKLSFLEKFYLENTLDFLYCSSCKNTLKYNLKNSVSINFNSSNNSCPYCGFEVEFLSCDLSRQVCSCRNCFNDFVQEFKYVNIFDNFILNNIFFKILIFIPVVFFGFLFFYIYQSNIHLSFSYYFIISIFFILNILNIYILYKLSIKYKLKNKKICDI